MSDEKTICTICGDEIPPLQDNVNVLISYVGMVSEYKTWRVCPECKESFNEWVSIRKKKKEVSF